MQIKHLFLAAGLLLGSATIAAAAPAVVTSDLNLRSGPGTNYGVINVLPGGATVDVLDCEGSWCRVGWGNAVGFASRSYLGMGGPVYAARPPVVVRGPVVVGRPYGYRWGRGWGRAAARYHWRHNH